MTLSFFTLLIVSCKKDKETVPTQTTDAPETYKAQVTGKWIVGDGSTRIAANTSGYSSFEFTGSGSYIITKTDNTCLTGFYTIDSTNNIITLRALGSTVGVITIAKLGNTVMNFALRLTGTSTDITIFSSKTGSIVSTSSRTDSLCQTWAMVTRFQNGVEDIVIKDSIQSGFIKATVIISSMGTFLTVAEQKGVATQYNSGSWSWANGSQTTINTGSTSGGQVAFVNGNFQLTYTAPAPASITIKEVYQKVIQ